MASVVQHTARQFARAIVMPNLSPPVVTVKNALDYRARIMAALPEHSSFNPLMTLYLTPETSKSDIRGASKEKTIAAVKLYPAGATTHSDAGVRDFTSLNPIFETMQEEGLPLLLHGESTRKDVDIFDREAYFIEETLEGIVRRFPELNIVFEHITTKSAADYIKEAKGKPRGNHHSSASFAQS